MSKEKKRLLQVSEETAKKLDKLKAMLLLANDKKETADSILSPLLDREIANAEKK